MLLRVVVCLSVLFRVIECLCVHLQVWMSAREVDMHACTRPWVWECVSVFSRVCNKTKCPCSSRRLGKSRKKYANYSANNKEKCIFFLCINDVPKPFVWCRDLYYTFYGICIIFICRKCTRMATLTLRCKKPLIYVQIRLEPRMI